MEKQIEILRKTLLKTISDVDDEKNVKKHAKDLMETLVDMKRINRELYLKNDEKRAEIREATSKLDNHFLKLQNLEYERDHLIKEIERCKQFETPETRKIFNEKEKSSNHGEIMKSLTSELDCRMQQQSEQESLRKKMKSTTSISVQKEKLVEELPKALASIRKIIEPLGELMPKANTMSSQLLRTAKTLPLPLFVLYGQLSGFEDAFEIGMEFKIVSTSAEKSKNKKRKRESEPDAVDVSFCLRDKERCVLRFELVEKLHVVIVKPIHSEVKEDVARALHNLFPGDNAETLPSTCARHAAAVRVDKTDNENAFRWVQWLAGLQGVDPVDKTSQELATQTIVRRLQSRLQSRSTLRNILQDIGVIKNFVHNNDVTPLFPDRIVSKLNAWREISKKESPNRVFLGTLSHSKKNKLNFIVNVGSDYPTRSPTFSLVTSSRQEDEQQTEDSASSSREFAHLSKNNKHFQAEDLRSAEAEVNVYYEEMLPHIEEDSLLQYQLLRLRMCMDVLVAASNVSASVGSRLRRGKDRRLAFKFDPVEMGMVHR
eukprot:g1192.t1